MKVDAFVGVDGVHMRIETHAGIFPFSFSFVENEVGTPYLTFFRSCEYPSVLRPERNEEASARWALPLATRPSDASALESHSSGTE